MVPTSATLIGNATERQTIATVCQTCTTGLFSRDSFSKAWSSRSLYDGFSYHTTWEQICASSSQGCSWCSLLLASKDDTMVREDLPQITVGISPSRNKGATPYGVQVLKLMFNNIPNSTFYIYTIANNPASDYIIARDILLKVSSPTTCNLAFECMNECILHHKHCPKPQHGDLPTRVIDCSDPKGPTLVITGGLKDLYVALSYVWGESQPNCTTTQNLSSYLKKINADLLPQTTKDAITTTCAYGLRYLWEILSVFYRTRAQTRIARSRRCAGSSEMHTSLS
ncbi:unnamed protein product [Somion occarium]|uniref:Heterokaryon incompatibility domain-containing protein n=1 Tax=Somion occarium TaxID=3059160 RepID=A0ABP1D7H4_9APHY